MVNLFHRHQADDDDISGLMCVPLCIPKKQDTGLRSYVEQRVKSAWTHCSAEDVKLRNSILSHRLKWETGLWVFVGLWVFAWNLRLKDVQSSNENFLFRCRYQWLS